MVKKFPINRVKTHRVYTISEVTERLGCHKRTVSRWIKECGLPADTSKKPWLIEGRDLKVLLGARQIKARCKLALHHFYCFGCKAPQEPDGKIADYVQQAPDSGRLIGLCPACGALMHKVFRRNDLEAIRSKIEVTVQRANPRLVSRVDPPSSVTLVQEAKPNGKAQQG